MSEEAVITNAADEDQQQSAKKKLSRKREVELADMREILKTISGRRVLWRLLCRAGMFKNAHAGEQTHLTSFNLGEANIGRFLWDEINHADDSALFTMMQEGKVNA